MGYGPQLLTGTWLTIQLALLSLAVALALGLLGASAKLSSYRLLRIVGALYTTLIRGIPDLVLLLLLFFSIQLYLNEFTDALDLPYIEIDPFSAGVLTLGFIYGAYFTETFRGALLAVPKGQKEAGIAYGFSNVQIFWRIVFPQMMRHALPGLGNNWQVLLKATALVSLIGLNDVVKVASNAGSVTFHVFFFACITGLIYLALTALSNAALYFLNKKYAIGMKRVAL